MTNKQKVLSDDSSSTTFTPPIDCKGGIRKLKKEINNTNFRQNYFELRVGEQKIRHETKLKDLDETTKDRLKFMSIIKISSKEDEETINHTSTTPNLSKWNKFHNHHFSKSPSPTLL
ncbi:predicted protein [Naegleria gruberi]|uniref:Predicted protein n=1 Tax=Naegleria gruberi TaxID=5762 RepID=D2V6T8_NAEGR|nr:uncharacterized protein NAEGRDRAFT_47126 [Naegleria gruberi]EFC47632.1 predicted protein [Naegleria gruberi]|eukprot:XP_002680376.1 predicted protein [Naegleria gruberi strain NEG-M]